MKSSCGCQTCDKRELRTEFVHRSIDRLGTGKEFNRIGTLIKCASNLFYFKTSHLVHFFNFNLNYFSKDLLNMFRVNAHV